MQTATIKGRTNQDTGILGLIAVACMIVDHLGSAFFRGNEFMWMRVVGRIAFPLFAWGIAVGAEHTRSIARYALRLLVLFIISQPFFMFGLNHTLLELNIFATLLLGLLGIWGLKERREWLTVLALLVSQAVMNTPGISMDYGIRGVLCILLLWAVRENPLALATCYAAFCILIWGPNYTILYTTRFFTVRLQMAALLALPFMLYPAAKRTPTPRWLMYAVYPGHLALIWLAKALIA